LEIHQWATKKKIKFDKSFDKSYSIDCADLDLDGDIDIVVGNSNSPNSVFYNMGNGMIWTKSFLSTDNFKTYDIKISDINNDGRPDILESNSDEKNIFYLNNLITK
tara:strand:+ start:231 stop:548 length:318 start_codon:yes stop_codon:yes gene_type:complete